MTAATYGHTGPIDIKESSGERYRFDRAVKDLQMHFHVYTYGTSDCCSIWSLEVRAEADFGLVALGHDVVLGPITL